MMVAYSFQGQFVEPIRIGLIPGPIRPGGKRHTIRAHGKRRHADPGNTLQLYRGMRTRQCFKIGDAICSATPSIKIEFARPRRRRESVILKDAGFLDCHSTSTDLDHFARSDGFDDWSALREFWSEHHPGVVDFDGVMIEWLPIAAEEETR